jgi:hypothetical protein
MGIEITVNMNKGGKPEMDDKYDDMAEKGRGTDEVMGHLTVGEIVLPVELAQKLEPMLKKEFEAMDLDIEQYTVGHEKNSINPKTGFPEFFFKGVVNAVSSVVKPVASAVGGAINSVTGGAIGKITGALGLTKKPSGPSAAEIAAEEAAIKKLQDEEAALKKVTSETEAQSKALAEQMDKERALAEQQSARFKTESEGIQRESAERRLARLRARKRSGSRPMLSRGVSLKGEA